MERLEKVVQGAIFVAFAGFVPYEIIPPAIGHLSRTYSSYVNHVKQTLKRGLDKYKNGRHNILQ